MTLLRTAAVFLLGVYLGAGLDVAALALFGAAAVLAVALLASLHRAPWPAVLVLVLVLGAARAGAVDDPSLGLSRYRGLPSMAVEGVVGGDPEAAGSAIRFRLSVDSVRPDQRWESASGDVLVTLQASSDLVRRRDAPYVRYGDRLLLEGALREPPELEGFDYPTYLARQGIGSVMAFPEATLTGGGEGGLFPGWLHGARRSLAESLEMVVPEPQASLGQALLLGLRDGLPDDLVEEFRVTGTSHLLAISGLHLAILLGLSLAVSARLLGRRRQLYLLAPLVLVWLYALLAGMSPSVARAAIMGSVYLAAHAMGRPRSVLPGLGLAAALMVALEPDVLWSVSFQLSFAAMAGIAVLAEPLNDRLRGLYEKRVQQGTLFWKVLGAVSLTTAMTISATAATLPLAAFYFERLPLVGLPATLLSLPALPLVLGFQAAAAVVGLVSPVVAAPFGWLAWVTTAYITEVVGLFSGVPIASVETGRVAPFLVWAYYGGFALWFGARSLGLPRDVRELLQRWAEGLRDPPPGVRRRAAPWWAVLTATAVAALVWTAALSLPNGRLHVTMADVGQGDATLITTPGGLHILVDGGPDSLAAARLVGKTLPFWDRDIYLVVLTHAHADHVTGLTEVLLRYDVANILEPNAEHDTPGYTAWRQAVSAEGASVTQAASGQVVSTRDGVLLEVLGPPPTLMRGTSSDIDNNSVVLRLVYGDVSFLLAGDIFGEAERAMLARDAPIDSDVLKVAHHGSRNASSEEFLGAVTQAAAVVSAGEGNRFGHPHAEVMESLGRRIPEESLFVTFDRGDVEFVTDGKRLTVSTER